MHEKRRVLSLFTDIRSQSHAPLKIQRFRQYLDKLYVGPELDMTLYPSSIQAVYSEPNVTSYDKSPCGKKCGPNRGSSKASQKEVKVILTCFGDKLLSDK